MLLLFLWVYYSVGSRDCATRCEPESARARLGTWPTSQRRRRRRRQLCVLAHSTRGHRTCMHTLAHTQRMHQCSLVATHTQTHVHIHIHTTKRNELTNMHHTHTHTHLRREWNQCTTNERRRNVGCNGGWLFYVLFFASVVGRRNALDTNKFGYTKNANAAGFPCRVAHGIGFLTFRSTFDGDGDDLKISMVTRR